MNPATNPFVRQFKIYNLQFIISFVTQVVLSLVTFCTTQMLSS